MSDSSAIHKGVRTIEWLGELRLALRRLSRVPGFTLGSVLTLAIGISATTAIFSVASAVLLRPLPYPEPSRLLAVGQQYRDGLAGVGEPKFIFWREKSRSFEALACYSQYGGAGGNLVGGGAAEFVSGLRVSEDFFKVLGVVPALGRAFTAAEDTKGAPRVAILSDGLWRRAFGGDPEIVGRVIRLNDTPLTVVGVMPQGFRVESAADLFLPMQAVATSNHDPNASVVGRLKAGVTEEQAGAEMAVIAEQFRKEAPRSMQEGESIFVRPYQEQFTEGRARLLWILLGAVSFLLLIACANVAHVQLSRAAGRSREFAVRAALGGGISRITLALAAESLVVAFAAGGLGTALAFVGTRLLVRWMPAGYLPDVSEVTFDWRVLAFALGTAILTGLLAASAPVFQARRLDIAAALKDGGGRGSTGRGRLRGALIVTELALSVALLAGAGVLTRTFVNLIGVAPGFDPRSVLTFQLAPSGPRYATTASTVAFLDRAKQGVARLPGVQAVSVINKLPLDWQFNMPVLFPDLPEQFQNAQVRMISPDYFNVMSIPLRQGRDFSERDDASSPPVAIVNEAFARRYLGGSFPFARRLVIGRGYQDASREVVAVVGDIKQGGLDQAAPPMVFVPMAQLPDRLMDTFRTFTMPNMVVKTSVDPRTLLAGIRLEVAAADPAVAVASVSSMEDLTARSVAPQRFNMILIAVFGGVALFLALIGVYGVISYGVAQQSREFGVRLAVGATSRDLVRQVVNRGLSLAVRGGVLGAVLFIGLGGIIQGLLYEVSARDPLVLGLAFAALASVVLLASYLPARRAAAVDPVEALRAE